MNDEAMLIRLNEILENKQLSFSERHSMREAIKRFQAPAHDGEAVKPYLSIEFKDYATRIIPGETDGMKNGKVDCYLQGRTLFTAPPRVVDVELLEMLVRIRDDKTWRTNDNSLWPDLLAMIRKHETALEKP